MNQHISASTLPVDTMMKSKKTIMTRKDWANHWEQAREKRHLDMPGTGPQALQPLDHGIIIQELYDFTTLEWREA